METITALSMTVPYALIQHILQQLYFTSNKWNESSFVCLCIAADNYDLQLSVNAEGYY